MTDVADQYTEAFDSGSERTSGAFDQIKQRPQISVGAAIVLVLGAIVGTRIYMRRRTIEKVSRLAQLALKVNAVRSSMPPASGPVGGAGGAVLLTALLVARARQAHTQSRVEELSARLAALESEAAARLHAAERPRPRDLVIGAVAGLAVMGVISRLGGRRSS